MVKLEIENKIISYFIKTCQEDGYGFIKSNANSLGQNEICIYKLENNEFENIKDYWVYLSLEDTSEVLLNNYRNIDKKEMGVFFGRTPISFFEHIWNKCRNVEERKICLNLFFPYIINSRNPFDELILLKNNEFQNDIITMFYENETIKKQDKQFTLINLLDISQKNNIIITEDNLHLICKYNNYELSKIEEQAVFKKYIHTISYLSPENFKRYWSKIDQDLIINQDFVKEGECIYISFNKIYLFNMNPGNDLKFYEGRLKTVSNYLNKKEVREILKIGKNIFDGKEESEKFYTFIVMNCEDKKNLKKVLEEVVNNMIKSNEEISLKSIQTIINYQLLEDKISIKEEVKVRYNKKI